MNPGVIAVSIPIIFFVVVGLVIITGIYFHSREKQMLIEKGLNSDEIKKFYEREKNPYILTKIGIITIFLGIAISLGVYLGQSNENDHWVVLSLFSITGIGLIVANFAGRKLDKDE